MKEENKIARRARMTPADVYAIRQQLKLTPQQLAEILGVNQGTILAWERGVQGIKEKHIIKLEEMRDTGRISTVNEDTLANLEAARLNRLNILVDQIKSLTLEDILYITDKLALTYKISLSKKED